MTDLGTHFGIEYLAHDALEDSRTCGQLIKLAADKCGVNSVEELLKACGTLVISIAVIPDFIYLPLAITAALIAGVLSLLFSWTEEKKARQKSKRDAIKKAVKGIILIIDARIA